MRIIFLLSLFASSIVNAQQSTILGTVILTLNYINSNSDVGASVTLFNLNQKYSNDFGFLGNDSALKTFVDNDGHFSFNSLDTGKYLVYIQSKGAIQNGLQVYSLFTKRENEYAIEKLTSFDLSNFNVSSQKEIDSLVNDFTESFDKEKSIKKRTKKSDVLNEKCNEFIKSWPSDIKLYFYIFSAPALRSGNYGQSRPPLRFKVYQ